MVKVYSSSANGIAQGVITMLPLLVILCPPLAVLLTATKGEAAKNLGLSCLLYVPGLLHAREVVERYNVNRQYDNILQVLELRATSQRAA